MGQVNSLSGASSTGEVFVGYCSTAWLSSLHGENQTGRGVGVGIVKLEARPWAIIGVQQSLKEWASGLLPFRSFTMHLGVQLPSPQGATVQSESLEG